MGSEILSLKPQLLGTAHGPSSVFTTSEASLSISSLQLSYWAPKDVNRDSDESEMHGSFTGTQLFLVMSLCSSLSGLSKGQRKMAERETKQTVVQLVIKTLTVVSLFSLCVPDTEPEPGKGAGRATWP